MPLPATMLVLIAVVISGCSEADPKQPDRPPGAAGRALGAELTVVDGKLTRTTWAIRDELYVPGSDRPEKLGGPVQATLTGTYAPAAVPNPADDRVIAYGSFHKGRPVLSGRDLAADTDSTLDEGASAAAWGRPGGVAYFKGTTPRVADPAHYRGHVVVRRSPESRAVRWTAEPGRYIVSAWAGERLVVHELTRRWPRLLVLDGPGRRRVLAERATLVALSPDGTRAFVAKEPRRAPAVAVVDVASGRELASFTFSGEVDPIRRQKIDFVAASGAWAGDRVIAAVTGGLAVFRVTADRVALEELLGVDPEAFPTGLSEPSSDQTGRYVVAGAELMQRPGAPATRTSIMECDLVERRCVLGPSAPSFLPPRHLYNPSRP